MLIFLRLYISDHKHSWTSAADLAAVVSGRSQYHSRRIREWTWNYLDDHRCLPVNLYGNSKKSIMTDENFVAEIKEYIRTIKNKFFTAEDVAAYVNRPEFLRRLNRTKPFAVSTVKLWLKEMDFTFDEGRKGMYVDGHEREDVVAYRQNEFCPAMAKYEEEMGYIDGALSPTTTDSQTDPKVILLTHDESTFYANDQRKKRWRHKDEVPEPQPKGEGNSIMISDFCVPQTGFLTSKDG